MSFKIHKYIFAQLPKSSEIVHELKNETKIYMHFYNPIGDGDWYVIAGEQDEKDWTFLGIILFDDSRLASFTLKELKNKKLPFDYKIQMNEKFRPQTWKEIMASKTS